jgi:hypothetical protein
MIPPGGYTLRHVRDGNFGLWPTGNGLQFRDYFTVHEGRNWNVSIFRIFIQIATGDFWVEQEVLRQSNEAVFQETVLAWAVERVERGLRDGEFADGVNRIIVGVEELKSFEQITVNKQCDYQVPEGRDLFCTADTSSDPKLGPMRIVGLKSFSPTSHHQCRMCTLPDSRFLCSQLSHPSLASGVADKSRLVRDAKCGVNMPNIQNGGSCHAGGHSCWEFRVMQRQQDYPPVYVSPALTRALDYLDTAWRLLFKNASRLVTTPGIEKAGSLERECATREEFGERVIALADIIAAFQPDSVLDPATIEERKGSLSRLEAALSLKITDQVRLSRALDAIRVLRAANDLRSAVAHGGYKARSASAKAEIFLGVRLYPEVSWRAAWNDLRSRVTEALSVIAGVRRESA